ncbi:MAG: LuxR family transcriptional regulator, partial [Burkholderiales bacterium]|nr:LuxR family transcriptional regulator [Burkholderiales bacterium]
MTVAGPIQSNAAARATGLTLDRFGALVEAIYDAALVPANWADCLELIRSEFDGNYVSLIVRPGLRDDLGLIVSASGGRRIVNPGNPLLQISPFTGLVPDKLVTIGDILSETDWRNSQYYRDWCAPRGVFHVLAVDIGTSDGGIYGFRVTRPEGSPDFS